MSDLLLYVAGAKLDEGDDSTGDTRFSSLSDLLLYIAGADHSAEEDSTFSALLSYVVGASPIFATGMGSIFSDLLLYPPVDGQSEVPEEVTSLSDLLL